MSPLLLILYTREGCCICKGLEERLRNLSLSRMNPPLELRVIDIDAADTPKEIRARYNLQVPVMMLARTDLKEILELPRVSPRLNGEGLYQWLQKLLINKFTLT